MKKERLKFLGRDSGFGDFNTSAYIEHEKEFMLIDCGFTVFERLKNDFDFNKYEKIVVLITHLHNDHVGSLSQFILYIWFVYNKKITIVSKCKNIKEYLKITGVTEEEYELTDKYEDVELIRTEHVEQLDCYGIKIRDILYTGDTKTLEPFVPYLKGITEFYVDMSCNGGVHLKFEEVFDKLKNIKNKGIKIVLMHIDDLEYITKVNNNEFLIAKVE